MSRAIQKTLNQLNLAELRQLTREFNLDSKGTKSQLIARLINPKQLARQRGGAVSP